MNTSDPLDGPETNSQEVARRPFKESGAAVVKNSVKALVESPAYSRRFKDVLGSRAPQFVSSLVQISQTWQLQKCDPNSVIAAAMVAAALDLPINPNLGFAYIIPYKDKASFQMGYKGFIQLAQRSGQYKRLNTCEVYDGDLISYDRLRGDVKLDENQRKKNAKVVGYAAYFELTNGHEHTLYWTMEQVEEHAARYSQAYRADKDTPWKTNFDAMAKKTVLKMLISQWGPLSIQMQNAVERDQSVEVGGEVIYPDNDVPAGASEAQRPEPDAGPKGKASKKQEPQGQPAEPTKLFDQTKPTEEIVRFCKESDVTEAQVFEWAKKQKLVANGVEELVQMAESKLVNILTNWNGIIAEIKKN